MKRMNRAISLLKCLLLSTLIGACADSRSVPVMVGGNAEADACGAVGEVRGLREGGDGFLAVRTGPGAAYPIVDKIGNGQLVYLCDATADGVWLAVVFSSDEDECGVTSPLRSRQPYKGPCRSGWVKATWVEVVAG